MTRYKKHMQHIHNQATASSIEMAVTLLLDDISEYLIKSGVKPDSRLIKEIKEFNKYEYNPNVKMQSWGRKSGVTDI